MGNKEDFFMRQTHHKSKIYTKTGDKGQTSLYGGKRVLKNDPRIEAYGDIDELNSVIGIVVAQVKNSKVKSQNQVRPGQNYKSKVKRELIKIQYDLLAIGSQRASSNTKYLDNRVKEIEEMIDDLSQKLPKLKNFILPGGGKVGSFLHLARAVCRRAERRAVKLSEKEMIDKNIIIYLNRLSDLLFILARFVNLKERQKEVIWSKDQ